MRKQIGGVGRKVPMLFAAGISYYLWVSLTGIPIPCVFRKVTGWLCPGCGITTLFLCLGHLDFKGAFLANPFLFVTGPFLVIDIVQEYRRSKKNKRTRKWNQVLRLVYIAALLVFGVVRNLR